jgi:hypothetical protein
MALTRTAQQVIDCASEHEQMDRNRGLQLLNEAHIEIIRNCHLIPDTTMTINLTAGTQEYALPDSCVRVWDAAYFSNASSHTPLKPTNVDALYNQYGPNWQLQDAGVPWSFYERGGMVGLVPAPSVTTVTGYPNVTLYYTAYTALDFYDTLPTTIFSMYPWVYFICAKQAVVTSPDKVAMYEGLYQKEMKQMQEAIFGRIGRDNPRLALKVPRLSRA